MPDELNKSVARLDREELTALASLGSNRDRGRLLLRLLRLRGINPDRLYQVSYYPHRRCWLFTQELGPRAAPPASASQGDEAFFAQLSMELRRTALAACAAPPPRDRPTARCELPPTPLEMTPADLAELIGGGGPSPSAVRFDSEGGWQEVGRAESPKT